MITESTALLVNETHPLPAHYTAENLVSLYSLHERAFLMPPVDLLLNADAAEALNRMCRAAKEEGSFECIVTSAYRTGKQQEARYRTDLSRSTARPGSSEHETGLAVDIISVKPSRTMELHKYLRENSYRFGYISRYRRGREMITRMVECPEHFRFVGTREARIIKEKGLTLEEYHDPSIVRPDPYDPGYIFMSIFGPKMKGNWQKWPDIDIEKLRAVNPDVVGWIYMENTPINYPIMFHEEYHGYYLSHNFSGEPSAHGGIEMMSRPEDGIFILQGHHMKDCSMFMKLIEISDQKTFDVHPGISLNYEGTIYDAVWFAALEKRYGEGILLPASEDEKKRKQWLGRLKEESFLSNDICPEVTDQILVCSTCNREGDGVQLLYGVMRQALRQHMIASDDE